MIQITDAAKDEFQNIIKEQNFDNQIIYLRVRICGGGCSGFITKLDLELEINKELDIVFEINGINVVVDKRSILYLDNAKIDFLDDLNARGFHVEIPQAVSRCGCKKSFSF